MQRHCARLWQRGTLLDGGRSLFRLPSPSLAPWGWTKAALFDEHQKLNVEWLVCGWKGKLFAFQMLCRFLLTTMCGSYTEATFIRVEIVLRGVSRK